MNKQTCPFNANTNLEYQGRNPILLVSAGFKSPKWATFLQWRELDRKIIKGSKGTHLATFGEDSDGEKYMSHFVVFNEDQTIKI